MEFYQSIGFFIDLPDLGLNPIDLLVLLDPQSRDAGLVALFSFLPGFVWHSPPPPEAEQ